MNRPAPIVLVGRSILAALVLICFSAQGWSQTSPFLAAFSSSNSSLPSSEAPAPSLPPASALIAGPHVETSLSLGVFPQLTATRITAPSNGVSTESLTPSAGVLGTFRQSFKPWLGYAVNMGYTRASEHYTDNAGTGSAGTASNVSIPANVYEFSASYVTEKHITPRLTAFADVGGGMIVFLPVHRGADAINFVPSRAYVPFTNYRPAGVAGVGFDYRLNRHLGMRAEYRGQLYKYADYGNALPRNYTVTSEPTLSLTYNFGPSK
ncbi:hypothetical protein GOB94_08685 [Granulicella sp. 5B5]|uniref:hypothetical protein n=1 Tax=Granulicella sp. 5B5 TaxID=1617967 RepID=UPI0015F4F921|nr:hypothetical protein [Granulicella sp. 5B5]QMV18750.1 hypothetical protein GOB94_08685 [Granulicella sp. 5B5]